MMLYDSKRLTWNLDS